MDDLGIFSTLRVSNAVDGVSGEPEDQLEAAFRLVRAAFRKKAAVLESELNAKKTELQDKDSEIAGYIRRINKLESELQEQKDKSNQALDDLSRITNENLELNQTVRKLRKDLSKLQSFKKAILETLTDEDATHAERAHERDRVFSSATSPTSTVVLSNAHHLDPYNPTSSTLASSRSFVRPTNVEESNHYRNIEIHGGSSVTPSNVQRSAAPTPVDAFRMASPAPLSKPVATPSAASRESPLNVGPTPQRDYASESHGSSGSLAQEKGKQYFQKVRSQLKPDQFTQFLNIVKKLNTQQQTREQTLVEVAELFGHEHHELYTSFRNLLTHHG
eukprot:TRINITY_DN6115_c0_g1_i1.p1 TRINITY_DN6115_c0_g1~~TRINITY_DN6115_c0_g1_i1.p1  ORF type:complete len:332 (-),score=83.40 TRINITY_DN6115_c0_g1_i1:281-1276(-)